MNIGTYGTPMHMANVLDRRREEPSDISRTSAHLNQVAAIRNDRNPNMGNMNQNQGMAFGQNSFPNQSNTPVSSFSKQSDKQIKPMPTFGLPQRKS